MDWRARFRVKTYPWSEVARRRPDRGLLVVDNHLSAWEVDTGEIRPLVHRPHGVVLFAINRMIDPLGRWIYFLDDAGGNEIGHIARIPFEGGEAVDLTPDLPGYTVVGLAASLNGSYLALNTACEEGFSLRLLDLEKGTRRLVHRAPREFIKAQVSRDGDFTAVMTTELTGCRHYAIRVYDSAGLQVAELWDDSGANFWLTAFSPTGKEILASGLRDDQRRALIWNPETGERRWLQLEGSQVTPLDWSVCGSKVLLSSFTRGVQSLCLYDLERDCSEPVEHPPGAFGEYGGTYARFAYFRDPETVHMHWQDSVTPLGLRSDTRGPVLQGDPPPARPWTNVSFTSEDGTEIQAWLGLPKGEGPFPTVINIHGGPHLVMTEVFCAASQAWMDHGFAFLSLNYRGSTTFGCRFQEQIWGNLGHLELQDLVAARDFLVASGHAQAGAIYLNGESYGGYMTLWGLARRPDLWAGGMAGVALTDWTETYRDASPALQGAFRNWFGGSPEEVPERYRDSSPVHLADRIEAPVLLFQGRNDSRTPPRQAELFVEKMRQAGKSVRIEWFDGGHAMDADCRLRFMETMLDFVNP